MSHPNKENSQSLLITIVCCLFTKEKHTHTHMGRALSKIFDLPICALHLDIGSRNPMLLIARRNTVFD